MYSQRLYHIINPMRFLLAFHITLVIKDKNNFDVHLPYTDTQSIH